MMEPCTECGESISTTAQKCPHCGNQWPTRSATNTAWMGCAVVAAILLVAVLLLWPIVADFVDALFF